MLPNWTSENLFSPREVACSCTNAWLRRSSRLLSRLLLARTNLSVLRIPTPFPLLWDWLHTPAQITGKSLQNKLNDIVRFILSFDTSAVVRVDIDGGPSHIWTSPLIVIAAPPSGADNSPIRHRQPYRRLPTLMREEMPVVSQRSRRGCRRHWQYHEMRCPIRK
jgi:hypothetical protein